MEKIANSDEARFIHISNSIDKLLENNVSKDDLEKLGEEILASNRKVIEILDPKIGEILAISKETLATTKRIEDLQNRKSTSENYFLTISNLKRATIDSITLAGFGENAQGFTGNVWAIAVTNNLKTHSQIVEQK